MARPMFLCLCRERGLTQVKTGAVQEGSQPAAQSESIGKDCERTGAAGDDRSHEAAGDIARRSASTTTTRIANSPGS